MIVLDPATPLVDVTFVVLDLETTGTSAEDCAITEVGALKFRGGERLATFATLVNPGIAVPPDIAYLTGITEAMVAPAPRIESVLPALAEFIGDAVIVGHNVRFDLGFLRANLARLGYPPLTNAAVDTWMMARRLLRDDVPDHKLRTVARHLRTEVEPCHRALADAAATAEVLHDLLERAGTMGVTALDDLLALPATSSHPQVAKLRWVGDLPRRPGVYAFRDLLGQVLFVGRAADLRRRVRSHFAGRDGRRIDPLLREAHSLEHVVCGTDLEATVLELRLVHEHSPRYNPQVKARRASRYLRLAPGRPAAIARATTRCARGSTLVGPLPLRAARAAAADDRLLTRVLRRQEQVDALIAAGRLVVELDGGEPVVVDCGRLVTAGGPTPPLAVGRPLPLDAMEEAAALAGWLDARAGRVRIVHAEHGWSRSWPRPVVA